MSASSSGFASTLGARVVSDAPDVVDMTLRGRVTVRDASCVWFPAVVFYFDTFVSV
jgi:hypothetical protein